jgi:hypothetical protein
MSLLGSFLVIFTGLTLITGLYFGFLYCIEKQELKKEDENKKNLIE